MNFCLWDWTDLIKIYEWSVYMFYFCKLKYFQNSEKKLRFVTTHVFCKEDFFTINKPISWTGHKFLSVIIISTDDHENSWPTPLGPMNGKAPCHLQQNQTANFSSFVKLSTYKSTFTHTHTHTHAHTSTKVQTNKQPNPVLVNINGLILVQVFMYFLWRQQVNFCFFKTIFRVEKKSKTI